jgi:hypothetical protein
MVELRRNFLGILNVFTSEDSRRTPVLNQLTINPTVLRTVQEGTRIQVFTRGVDIH